MALRRSIVALIGWACGGPRRAVTVAGEGNSFFACLPEDTRENVDSDRNRQLEYRHGQTPPGASTSDSNSQQIQS
jgi:hypothetical protein